MADDKEPKQEPKQEERKQETESKPLLDPERKGFPWGSGK